MDENTASFITARQLRTHLRESVDTNHPFIVGNHYRCRAIIVPLGFRHYDRPSIIRKRIACANRMFRAAIATLKNRT